MFFNKFIDYVYPNVCGICGEKIKYDTYTCTNCLSILKCYRERYIKKCELKSYDELLSLYEYKGIIKKRILELKFYDGKYISNSFAYLLSKRITELELQFDVIIPVPISFKRSIERGYNQSKLIAERISKILGKRTISNVLIKIKNNKRQSELNINERKNNVINVYKIKNEENIKNKVILLIDDIYTTGATINECAKMLKNSGAKKVIVATIAYA